MKARAGLAAVLLVALAIVARQPLGASWARYADADAVYVGSGVSLVAGERSRYFDHPGIPLQALAGATFAGQYALERLTGGGEGLRAYAEATMLDLDRTRPWFRGWAILFYLAGAALAYLLVTRLLASWLLGVAAGLAWVAAPGIDDMSIQLRPDVPLTALCLVLAYLIAVGARRRDAGVLALAAFLLGIALTVKIHAAGMLVPLLLAAVLRGPRAGWWDARSIRETLARRRLWLAAGGVAWLGLVALLNAAAWPFGPAPSQRVLVLEVALGLTCLWLVTAVVARFGALRAVRPVFGPFPALVLTLVAAGTALSLSLVLSDAGLTLQTMKDNFSGGGANTGTPLFDELADGVVDAHPLHVLAVAALVVGTAVLSFRRREAWPPIVLAGAAVLWAMAAGRPDTPHYQAPAFVVAVVVALWLMGQGPQRLLAPLAVAVAAAGAAHAVWSPPVVGETEGCAAAVAAARGLVSPGEAVLAGRSLWLPDVEYAVIVETYVSLTPAFDYRFVEASPAGLALAKAEGLEPRYAVGPEFREGAPVGARPVYRDGDCGVVELA